MCVCHDVCVYVLYVCVCVCQTPTYSETDGVCVCMTERVSQAHTYVFSPMYPTQTLLSIFNFIFLLKNKFIKMRGAEEGIHGHRVSARTGVISERRLRLQVKPEFNF